MADDANITPTIHEHPTVATMRLRAKCERAVERLLAVLDTLEADPDEEPSLGFSEPSRPDWAGGLDQRRIAEGSTDDREQGDDDEPNVGWESHGAQVSLGAGAHDAEPALGWSDNMDQTRHRRSTTEHEDEPALGFLERHSAASCDQNEHDLGYGRGDDREDEHDGREPDVEDEPSLGSVHAPDQRHWADHMDPACSTYIDREEQCEGGGGDDACEDEGAACEGEGDHDEREPEDHHGYGLEYADDGHNQLVIVSHYGPGVAVSPLGVS